MHKYSGVILDFYDDQGATLKAKFPTVEELPDTIKTASVQPKEALPVEAFALVAVDGDDVLQKFACYDPGTTAMSVVYFMEHGHKLPEEAVKVAAANLMDACLEHGMLPPAALTKAAGAKEWAARNLPTFTAAGKKVMRGAKAVKDAPGRAARAPGKWVSEKARKVEERLENLAERAGDRAAAGAEKRISQAAKSPGAKKAVEDISQVAGRGAQTGALEAKPTFRSMKNIGIMAATGAGGVALGTAAGHAIGKKGREEGERLKRMIEKKSEAIDITGMDPMPKVKRAHADNYMFEDKFPIDSWDQIKKAEAYLLENDCRLDPFVRRECSVKLASRAVDVGYPVDDSILENGSYGFASPGDLMVAIEMRKVAGADVEVLYDLMEKRAAFGPDVYAECVRRFDIENDLDGMWDNRVLDPYRSTYGLAKTAEVVWEDGADRVDSGQLENLANNGLSLVTKTFTDDMAEEFGKDPVAIFQSMPEPQKRVIARMAADFSSDGGSEGKPKEAGLRVGDIEDELGVYLPDEREAKARKMIEYKKQRSFSLRHPWLTGIPTLGIAPAVAKSRAVSSIANRMAREDPGLRAATNKARVERRQQALENYQLQTERAKAEQAQRVAGTLGLALLGGMSARNRDRENERSHQRLMSMRGSR